MKHFFIVALLCMFSLASCAQGLPADSVTGKIMYRGAQALPANTPAAQAFGRAKIWLADYFGGNSILTDDAASGLLSGVGKVLVNDYTYTFRVRLQVEAKQVRYRVDDFAWQAIRSGVLAHGTPEEQRDSKLGIGKGARAKILAELDTKVRAGLDRLGQELTGSL